MHRRTLNWMGDRQKDKDIEVHLDGIGGVSILVKANVHRYGKPVNHSQASTFIQLRHVPCEIARNLIPKTPKRGITSRHIDVFFFFLLPRTFGTLHS